MKAFHSYKDNYSSVSVVAPYILITLYLCKFLFISSIISLILGHVKTKARVKPNIVISEAYISEQSQVEGSGKNVKRQKSESLLK